MYFILYKYKLLRAMKRLLVAISLITFSVNAQHVDAFNPFAKITEQSIANVQSINIDSLNIEFIKSINQYRIQSGLNSLIVDTSMICYANEYARYLATANVYDHSDLNNNQYVAENLNMVVGVSGTGFNFSLKDIDTYKNQIIASWKKSAGHNANLLIDSQYVGIGCYFYIVQTNARVDYKYTFVYVVR